MCLNGTYGSHVCPNLMHRWRKLNEVDDHVLGMAKSAPLRYNYKKQSRHRVVANNEVSMMLISIFNFNWNIVLCM
jgi:hypothetical protein